MAGWFGASREISREGRGASLPRPDPADAPQVAKPSREAATRLFAVIDNDRNAPPPVPDTDEPAVTAEAAAARPDFGRADAASRRRPVNLLGVAALGLWALAVALGIGAPLLGVAIDSGLVVGVLIASGVVSLLSLPFTALSSRDTDRHREP